MTTIRTRLTAWYVLFLALTLLGFGIFLQVEFDLALSQQLDGSMRSAATHLMVYVDESTSPPTLRSVSETAVDDLTQSSLAFRLVNDAGTIIAEMGGFPEGIPSTHGAEGYENITLEGIAYRLYTEQVISEQSDQDIWLQVAHTLTNINETRGSLINILLIGIPIAIAAAALGGLFMAKRALQPVDTITRTVQQINATDLTRRIHYEGATDELSRLTTTLNSMLERLDSAFDTERRFTADASHELRTPLTAIKGSIDVALTRQRSPEEYEATLNRIQHESDRLIRVVNDLLFLARLDAAPPRQTVEVIDLSDLLEAVVDQMRVMADEKGVIVKADIPAGIRVKGSADHLIRLYLNLMDNALKYSPEGRELTIRAEISAGQSLTHIVDQGAGIAPEHLPHLFDRFYRVERERGSSGGTGLGLALAYQIAREHGGTITVRSAVGTGTTFTVNLPSLLSYRKANAEHSAEVDSRSSVPQRPG